MHADICYALSWLFCFPTWFDENPLICYKPSSVLHLWGSSVLVLESWTPPHCCWPPTDPAQASLCMCASADGDGRELCGGNGDAKAGELHDLDALMVSALLDRMKAVSLEAEELLLVPLVLMRRLGHWVSPGRNGRAHEAQCGSRWAIIELVSAQLRLWWCWSSSTATTGQQWSCFANRHLFFLDRAPTNFLPLGLSSTLVSQVGSSQAHGSQRSTVPAQWLWVSQQEEVQCWRKEKSKLDILLG